MKFEFLERRVLSAIIFSIFFSPSCRQTPINTARQQHPEPKVEISPLAAKSGLWEVASADHFTITITAPAAKEVRVFYRPEDADDQQVRLGKMTAPTDQARGKFALPVNAAPDFAGEIYAEIDWPDGTQKKTEPIALTTTTALGTSNQNTTADSEADKQARQQMHITVDSDESEREDKFTGGKIEAAQFKPGDPRIAITVNIPAFRLTLWQKGREVKTYQIGIGRKNFPLPSGERRATAVIFNPRWVPPDSEWVRDSKQVEPFEKIEPDDPRNPLGKIKIPLGQAYLIHEAAKPSDIGGLVSHGCVRLATADLFDLAEKITAARGLPITHQQIAEARTSSERHELPLKIPLPVDLNYDTIVIEGDTLHLYPDVYDTSSNTPEKLREELKNKNVSASLLTEKLLAEMLARVSSKQSFVVSLADLRAGRALTAGRNEPLVTPAVEAKKSGTPK